MCMGKALFGKTAVHFFGGQPGHVHKIFREKNNWYTLMALTLCLLFVVVS